MRVALFGRCCILEDLRRGVQRAGGGEEVSGAAGLDEGGRCDFDASLLPQSAFYGLRRRGPRPRLLRVAKLHLLVRLRVEDGLEAWGPRPPLGVQYQLLGLCVDNATCGQRDE